MGGRRRGGGGKSRGAEAETGSGGSLKKPGGVRYGGGKGSNFRFLGDLSTSWSILFCIF